MVRLWHGLRSGLAAASYETRLVRVNQRWRAAGFLDSEDGATVAVVNTKPTAEATQFDLTNGERHLTSRESFQIHEPKTPSFPITQ